MRWKRFIPAALFALLGAAFAKANQPATRLAAPKRVECYCGCESKSKESCTKMCELPKYADRWWAVSCGTKAPHTINKKKESSPQATKKNRLEYARR